MLTTPYDTEQLLPMVPKPNYHSNKKICNFSNLTDQSGQTGWRQIVVSPRKYRKGQCYIAEDASHVITYIDKNCG